MDQRKNSMKFNRIPAIGRGQKYALPCDTPRLGEELCLLKIVSDVLKHST